MASSLNPPPALPDRDMSSVQFTILGLLLSGGLFYRQLLDILVNDFGYDAGERNVTAIQAFSRFEELGYIVSQEFGSEKAYQLTTQGEERWEKEFEYRKAAFNYWNERHAEKRPRNRPTGVKKERERKTERPPTQEELDAILKHAVPSFRRVLRFVYATNVRATDVIFAKIENLKMKEGILVLEPETYYGKPIKQREIHFGHDEELRRVIKEAVGDRKSGPVFTSTRSAAWSPSHLSSRFRLAKKKAGVADDVHMSGRGGKIGSMLANERKVGRWTQRTDRMNEETEDAE